MPEAALPTSLPGEINAACRSLHTNLNRLITSRLPLALPPYSSDTTPYATGLVHFSHVFFTFESLWSDLVSPSEAPTSPLLSFLLVNPYDSPELFSSPPSQETLQFLHQLRPKGLARSGRLKRDLEFLTGLHPTDLSVSLAQYPGDKVADFCTHIRKAVKQRPHVLVAYAWCYYMAVFSGGRWIRQQLMNADEGFWRTSTTNSTATSDQEAEQVSLKERGLAFWNFDGDNDGEDIKALFKSRLSAAEDLFTPSERIDIIEEAKSIFAFSASLVEELDEKLGTDVEKVDLQQRREKKRLEKDHADDVSVQVSRPSVMWLRRPEVTGVVVALGCLVFVALAKFDPMGGW